MIRVLHLLRHTVSMVTNNIATIMHISKMPHNLTILTALKPPNKKAQTQ